jgi:hypothetical protein
MLIIVGRLQDLSSIKIMGQNYGALYHKQLVNFLPHFAYEISALLGNFVPLWYSIWQDNCAHCPTILKTHCVCYTIMVRLRIGKHIKELGKSNSSTVLKALLIT